MIVGGAAAVVIGVVTETVIAGTVLAAVRVMAGTGRVIATVIGTATAAIVIIVAAIAVIMTGGGIRWPHSVLVP